MFATRLHSSATGGPFMSDLPVPDGVMKRIGVIGIGYVGRMLVDSLSETDAEFEVVGHDIDPEKKTYLTDRGHEWAETPADAADGADAVVLAVPGAPEVREIFEAADGPLDVLESGQFVVDTSTTGPDAAEALADVCAERGVGFLTAPLTRNAPAGGVHMMVGGSERDYEEGTPLLDVLSRRHLHLGSPADAQTFKVILQARYACQEAVDAEVVAFARDQGLDPRPYREFLGLDINEKYLERDFSPAISGMGGLAIWHKDLGYALDAAEIAHSATPITNTVFEAYKHGVRTASDDERNDTAILRYWEHLNDA